MAVIETKCSFAKSRSSLSSPSSISDYLYGHIRFPTSYDIVFGKFIYLSLIKLVLFNCQHP
ncbi:hypothetical protein GBA52_015159 [Prunus armeniaca]|nr:hypothetical protein GBA52_015159 [Prunus armeniaca]